MTMSDIDPLTAELAAIRRAWSLPGYPRSAVERKAARTDIPRLLAAVDAALKLAAEFNIEDGHYPDPGMAPVSRADRIRAAIERELTGGGASDA